MEIFSSLVTPESHIVVFDPIIEDMPQNFLADRPWGEGNNPKIAVWEFVDTDDRFVIDKGMENKVLITVSPDSWPK